MPSPLATVVDTRRALTFRHCGAALRCVVVGAVACCIAGCASLDFYAQAIGGQFEIWRKQQPIDAVLANPALASTTRAKLELVTRAREFAFAELALPDNGSYRDYVALDREFVVWNVFAAPALSLAPEQSCFVLVGCLAYRGYFSRDRAAAYAERLSAAGLDVHLAGVSAYSTLGWFDDPVLSTILAYSDHRIVEILFHELAHQQLYVTDDTPFNEGFAVAVAAAGLERWLAADGAAPERVGAALAREAQLMDLIMATRAALEALYAGALAPPQQLARKAQLFAELNADYAALKQRWGGVDDYDRFMAQPWNNAKISSLATYHELVPAFRALIASAGDDFAAAYAEIAAIAALPAAERAGCLQQIIDRGARPSCPNRRAAID